MEGSDDVRILGENNDLLNDLNNGGKDGKDAKDDIKIKKKKPIVKLDTAKLLNDERGIRKLYHMTKYDLNLKHEGHEFTDLQRLMALYRSWHAQFMPAYKYEYFVEQLQKLGKDKMVQMTMKNLRDLHKGRVDTYNAEMKVESKHEAADSDAGLKSVEDEYKHDEDDKEDEYEYEVENFQEYLEAERAQKEMQAKGKHLILNNCGIENLKPEESDDDLDDLEDVISDDDKPAEVQAKPQTHRKRVIEDD